jgi:hypothetical protein
VTRQSWPSSTTYAILVVVLFAIAAAYPAWVMTVDGVRRSVAGAGLLWIVAIDVVSVCVPAWLGWAAYRNHQTTFDDETISQPGVLGPKVVRWANVIAVRHQAAGLHLSDGRTTIVVAPFVYRQPTQVYADIFARVPSGV